MPLPLPEGAERGAVQVNVKAAIGLAARARPGTVSPIHTTIRAAGVIEPGHVLGDIEAGEARA